MTRKVLNTFMRWTFGIRDSGPSKEVGHAADGLDNRVAAIRTVARDAERAIVESRRRRRDHDSYGG